MGLQIKPVTSDLIDDFSKLFSSNEIADTCSCMWFIIPVKEFHAAGGTGNRASFVKMTVENELPVGLLAYQNNQPVGWCAVGPRSRYVRALKTPTYKGAEAIGNPDHIWMVPCFFIHPDARGASVPRALLEEAITLAMKNGASAIEGFPFSGTKKRSGDVQVGNEALFASCGFKVIRTPSNNRVVMRRNLNPQP